MITFDIENKGRIVLPFDKTPSPEEALYSYEITYYGNCCDKSKVVLSMENTLHAMRMIKLRFEQALAGVKHLESPLFIHNFGRAWNLDMHNHYTQYIPKNSALSGYTLFSVRGAQTWVYNAYNDIVIEIAPSYWWHGLQQKIEEHDYFHTFDQFMSTYKPYVVHTVDRNTAKQWVEEATQFLSVLEPKLKAWCDTPGEHLKQIYTLNEQMDDSGDRIASALDNQIVLFDKLKERRYFGYVCELEDLEEPTRTLLEESERLDLDGTILLSSGNKMHTNKKQDSQKSSFKAALNSVKSFFCKEEGAA